MNLEMSPKLNNINPEEVSDTSVYTGSLSMIEQERKKIKTRLESLKMQGKDETDLEVSGLLFNLKELARTEAEIRESMKNRD